MIQIIFFLFISPLIAFAAPHPATSTSALTAPETGYYFQHNGFVLKTKGTDWIPLASLEPNMEPDAAQTVRFQSKNQSQKALFSVRSERLSKKYSLESYAKRWMKDYPNYGFVVLAVKNFTLNGHPALLVDLHSKDKKKQLRQVILKNEESAAVLTCIDAPENFKVSVKSCNTIINSFFWNKDFRESKVTASN